MSNHIVQAYNSNSSCEDGGKMIISHLGEVKEEVMKQMTAPAVAKAIVEKIR